MLERLQVLPLGRRVFVMSDGSEVERALGEARVRLNGESRTTVMVFADDDNEALLGAYTLEGFALAVDPVHHQLVPIPRLPALQSHGWGSGKVSLLGAKAFFQTITLRVYSRTTLPSCLMPWVLNLTMPHCGFDLDSRTSTTSLCE